MVRIQLHLTSKQDQRLKALGRARGLSRAELIRDAIDAMLAGSTSGTDSLIELVGAAGRAGRTDLSERHDDVLYGFDEADGLPRVAEEPAPFNPRRK